MAKKAKLTGPEEVAKYFEALDHPLKGAMEMIRKIILEADPGITEHIKWNAPSFVHAGDDRVTFNIGRKGELRIVFHRGAAAKPANGRLIEDPSGMLNWITDDRATIEFKSAGEIESHRDALTELVRRWTAAAA